jgi:hypothetical protein
VLLAQAARADSLVVVGGSPRSIARAGAGTVGDDGGGALLVNPASLARREGKRVQLGAAIVDDSVSMDPAVPGAPHGHDQAGSSLAPLAAVEGSIGAWVLGAGVMTESVTSRSLRPPSDLPAAEVGASFSYRYSGIAGSIRRDTVAIGAARRLGESVALGISVGASRVHLSETRRIWAGFVDRDGVKGTIPISDASHDVELGFDGEDGFAPRAVLGVLVAPADTPVEIGASLSWEATADVAGSATAVGTPMGPSAVPTSPSASLALSEPWTLRAGARYLGERFVLEVNADLWIFAQRAESELWNVQGIRIVDTGSVTSPRTNEGFDLTSVPSRVSERTHGAVRAAADVELMGGFLWAIGGLSYTTLGTPIARLSPTFADLGGTTLGLGLEANAGSFSITLGWSRTWSPSRTQAASLDRLDNPFQVNGVQAGDASVPTGRFYSTADQVGILLDVELGSAN